MIPYLRETSVAFPLLISLSLQQTRKLSPLSELMSTVCEQRGLRPSKVRFFYKGERLTGDEVPAGTPSMKDGDEIAVIVLEDAVTNGEQWKLSRLRRVRSPTRRHCCDLVACAVHARACVWYTNNYLYTQL